MTSTQHRTTVAGISMALGGLLLIAPPFLGAPESDNGVRDRLTQLSHDSAFAHQQIAKGLIFQLALVLLLPGAVAFAGRVRGRGAGAVLSGAVVYAAGIFGIFTFITASVTEVAIARSGPVTDSMVTIDRAASGSPGVVPAMVVGLLCFHLLGLPWLTWGLVRARQIPRWLAATSTLGTVLAFFGSGTPAEPVGWILTGLSLATLGYSIARPAALQGQVDGARSVEPALIG